MWISSGVRSPVDEGALHDWIVPGEERPHGSLSPRWMCTRCMTFTFKSERPPPDARDRYGMTCNERVIHRIMSA